MHTWVYKGDRKAATYLFLPREESAAQIPDALRRLMGNLTLVADFDLLEKDHLAQADIRTVRARLTQKGYYLQLPVAECGVGS